MPPTRSRVKRSKACAVTTIYLQPKREVSILNMTEESKAFGEVASRVKRFKLDTSLSRGAVAAPGSAASTPPASAATASTSVYSHIQGIEDIQQLSGLRCARRRGRFRLIRRTFSEAILAKKYAEAISYLTPMFVEETQKQFANTISDIVGKHEGKEPQNKYAAEINKYKNRPTYQKAKRRRFEEDEEELPDACEGERSEEDITELTEEEIETRRLKREVLAAIAAITAGVQQEEMINHLYDLGRKK